MTVAASRAISGESMRRGRGMSTGNSSTTRPGRVIQTWDVDIPGARVLESPPVAALSAEITDRLRKEISRHAA